MHRPGEYTKHSKRTIASVHRDEKQKRLSAHRVLGCEHGLPIRASGDARERIKRYGAATASNLVMLLRASTA